MLYHLIAISLISFASNAQEQFTCMKADDDVITSPQPTLEGKPGRRGPPGPKGERGLGKKGEPGIPDNSLINSLRNDLTRALLRGYMVQNNGWIAPFNGYQYKATPTAQSWDASRRICQNWGSDLMVYGFRDLTILEAIYRGLALSKAFHWIGLNDKANEGVWLWVNGHRARLDDATLWLPGQPNREEGGANEDCAGSFFSNSSANSFYVYDDPCTLSRRAICEKRV